MSASQVITMKDMLQLERTKHIVAVCSVQPKETTPETDGWLLNDFFFLTHALPGGAVTRTFLTCIPPEELVDRYAKFAAEKGFDSRLPACVRICDPETLCDDFLDELEEACREAWEAEDEVLIVILGHGDIQGRGMEVGRLQNVPEPSGEDYLAIEAGFVVHPPDDTITGFDLEQLAGRFPEARVGLIVPEYFVGHWRWYFNLRVRDGMENRCLDRIEGSVFSFDIASARTKDDSEQDLDACRNLASKVRASLLGSCWGEEMDVFENTFSTGALEPQPKKWSMDGQDSGPVAEDSACVEYLPLSSCLRDRVGGSQSALLRLLRKQIKAHLQTCPRPSSIFYQAFVPLIKTTLLGTPNEEELENLTISLLYRSSLSEITMILSELMGLDSLIPFHRWDYGAHVHRHGTLPIPVITLIIRSELFPMLLYRDCTLEGMTWTKPIRYIASAFVTKQLSPSEMKKCIGIGEEYLRTQGGIAAIYALEKLGREGSIAKPYVQGLITSPKDTEMKEELEPEIW